MTHIFIFFLLFKNMVLCFNRSNQYFRQGITLGISCSASSQNLNSCIAGFIVIMLFNGNDVNIVAGIAAKLITKTLNDC